MKYMKKTVASLLAFTLGLLAFGQEPSAPEPVGPEVIIPVPAEFQILKGNVRVSEPELKIDAAAFRKAVGRIVPHEEEAYLLEITPRRTRILAASQTGAFYARQSLAQMEAAASGEDASGSAAMLKCCRIVDYPRYGYRGFMYDLSRNFRSKEFLERQMDIIARIKMNRLHLHLTDGAGWRLEIDAYPRLTNYAAWRTADKYYDWTDRNYVELSSPDPHEHVHKGYPVAYGGYLSKEDVRELLSYAHARHIEIIPEIEMPSHSDEVTAAYPQLSCTGEKSYDLCLGKAETMQFCKDVLDEVIGLFPSEYIHIGGDEAEKENWKHCPDCQALMKREGLSDVNALQSWFITRINEHVRSRGRRIIGWDDLLDGEVPREATVMAWWNAEKGTAAVQRGHEVIMAPAEYCYIQRTPDAPPRMRSAVNIYLPTDTVYVFEPVREGMSPEQASLIKGVSACVWTEGVDSEEFAEYLIYPRLLAIAETAWSRPEDKDLQGFRSRATSFCRRMRREGYSTFELENEYGQRKAYFQTLEHLARGKRVIYNLPVSERYPASGPATLTDGLQGGWTYVPFAGRWQGFLSDIDLIIDLETVQPVHYVGASFMHMYANEVCVPSKVVISLSEDGENFTEAATIYSDVPEKAPHTMFFTYGAPVSGMARYVRYLAFQGSRPWLFTDEIVVN